MPKITFVEADGTRIDTDASVGESVMSVAVNNSIDAILAECGGACACATCHCYVDPEWSNKTGEAGDTEKAMLECVIEPNDTSRLACQVYVTEELDGLVIQLPERQY